MGIDYNANMVVGADASDFTAAKEIEDIYQWLEDNEMVLMSDYDEPFKYGFFGFEIKDTKISALKEEWLPEVLRLSAKFKEITGLDAELCGMLNVS